MLLVELLDGQVVWRADLDNEGDREKLLARLNDTFPGTFEFVPCDMLSGERAS